MNKSSVQMRPMESVAGRRAVWIGVSFLGGALVPAALLAAFVPLGGIGTAAASTELWATVALISAAATAGGLLPRKAGIALHLSIAAFLLMVLGSNVLARLRAGDGAVATDLLLAGGICLCLGSGPAFSWASARLLGARAWYADRDPA